MDIQKLVKDAIQSEEEAAHIYQSITASIQDEKVKTVFNGLVEEEFAHKETLEALHPFLTGSKKDIPFPSIPKRTISKQQLNSKLFTSDMKEKINAKQHLLNAISFAMTLELSAEKQYKKMAEFADNQEAKTLLLFLATWEHEHYEFLALQNKNLLSLYGPETDFQP